MPSVSRFGFKIRSEQPRQLGSWAGPASFRWPDRCMCADGCGNVDALWMWMGCGDLVLKVQVGLDSDVDIMATDLQCQCGRAEPRDDMRVRVLRNPSSPATRSYAASNARMTRHTEHPQASPAPESPIQPEPPFPSPPDANTRNPQSRYRDTLQWSRARTPRHGTVQYTLATILSTCLARLIRITQPHSRLRLWDPHSPPRDPAAILFTRHRHPRPDLPLALALALSLNDP